jgi:hypothetical protein
MKLSWGAVVLCALIPSLLAADGYAASTDDAPPAAASASEAAPSSVPAPPAVQPPAATPPATQPSASAPRAATPVAASAPAGAPPSALKAANADPAKGKMDGATYAVRLRDLEARVDELKEQIRRSHTRLSLLSDTILSGGVGGARTSIRFQNDMSGAFRLTRALFVLDGAVQYNKQDDTGALSGQKEIPIFKGSITPGDHTLQVLLRLRGHGYGVFSYLRGYQFEVKQTHSFSVTEGKEVDLDVIAWEKGGVTTPLEQRPAVRYLEKLRDVSLAAPSNAESESAPPAAAGEDK